VYCLFFMLIIINTKADVLFSRVVSDIIVFLIAVGMVKISNKRIVNTERILLQ